MKILSFVGYHNSGKTTLIGKVISSLKDYKIAYIKHDPKSHAIIDKENSDTFRILSINHQSAILSGDTFVLYQKPKNLQDILPMFKDYDAIFLEGFKYLAFNKIKLGNIQEQLTNVIYEYDGDFEKLLNFIRGYIDGV